MNLSYRQENQLRRVEADLRHSDPHLGAMFNMFGKLYRDQNMPASEQMPPVPASQQRLHRAGAWIVAALIATALAIGVLLSAVAVAITGCRIRGTARHARMYRPGRGAGARPSPDWDQSPDPADGRDG